MTEDTDCDVNDSEADSPDGDVWRRTRTQWTPSAVVVEGDWVWEGEAPEYKEVTGSQTTCSVIAWAYASGVEVCDAKDEGMRRRVKKKTTIIADALFALQTL